MGNDFFFVGGSHHEVVKVAVKLIQHGVLVSKGGCSERSVLVGCDTVDGSCGVCGAKEIASSVGDLLLAFDSELGGAEGCFPQHSVFGGDSEAVSV